MQEIIHECNILWSSVIKKMEVDFLKRRILFELAVTDSGMETNHTLEINNYESLIWNEKSKNTHEECDFENCDYYEFTSITFRNFQANSNDKWLKQYSLDYNIAIEIWGSALLIKSNTVVVDSISFKI